MARLKIELPERFTFSTIIPIRITDINYGGHVGNDTILSIIHEARVQFLRHFQYGEMDLEGVGMIMSDASVEFKAELFYGDSVCALVAAGEFSRVGFTLFYKLDIIRTGAGDKRVTAAVAKTGMICFDYSAKKIAPLPARAREQLTASSEG